jgi:hypothetical protein
MKSEKLSNLLSCVYTCNISPNISSNDDVICYAQICYGVLFGAIHFEHCIGNRPHWSLLVREHVTNLDAALDKKVLFPIATYFEIHH